MSSFIFKKQSGIEVFSTGVVDLPDQDLCSLLSFASSPESSMQSLVLSHQSFSQQSSEKLADFLQNAANVKHLALINCWLGFDALAAGCVRGAIEHIHIEAITAGQIQQYADLLQTKGYRVAREISRHRIRMQRVNAS